MVEIPINKNEFLQHLKNIPKYFRINTLKISVDEFIAKSKIDFSDTKITHMKKLNSNIKLGNTIEYYLGLIHPQSLSSSLVSVILDSKENDIILDATASPGSKTTQIAAIMENKGSIVANDLQERLKPLMHNISRLGVTNTLVTNFDAKKPVSINFFDKVLLDAPCSALGSHLFSWERVNDNIVSTLSSVQQKMILSCFDCLKANGTLIYSTCTITKEENENIISYLLKKRTNARLEKIDFELYSHENGLTDDFEKDKVIRIYPNHVDSEAFFISKIRKIV